MIPAFTAEGSLPPGRHPATPQEIEHSLVLPFPTSMTRRDIFNGWIRRRQELLALVEIEAEWVDGSFVTNKRDPGDIDVVTLMREDVVDALEVSAKKRLQDLVVGNSPRLQFGCHSFPLMMADDGHPNHGRYLALRGYWDRWWGYHNGSFDKKGYLEVRGRA